MFHVLPSSRHDLTTAGEAVWSGVHGHTALELTGFFEAVGHDSLRSSSESSPGCRSSSVTTSEEPLVRRRRIDDGPSTQTGPRLLLDKTRCTDPSSLVLPSPASGLPMPDLGLGGRTGPCRGCTGVEVTSNPRVREADGAKSLVAIAAYGRPPWRPPAQSGENATRFRRQSVCRVTPPVLGNSEPSRTHRPQTRHIDWSLRHAHALKRGSRYSRFAPQRLSPRDSILELVF